MRSFLLGTLLAAASYGFIVVAEGAQQPPQPSDGTERHLRNITRLTSGGENAEACFSADGIRLVFQVTRAGYPCDQIYTMRLDGSDQRRVSTGPGRTTCGYFYPKGDEIVYASTHDAGAACPPRPSFERGYVWPIYAGYDIYRADADGTNLRPLTRTPGYDAEATIGPDGLITFTSLRDGGPFFSHDGRQIVFRGRAPGPGKELDEYRALLKEGLCGRRSSSCSS